jgi:hypothetical protein
MNLAVDQAKVAYMCIKYVFTGKYEICLHHFTIGYNAEIIVYIVHKLICGASCLKVITG